MTMTTRALNRATLARQLLLDREPLSVRDGLRRIVAVQAQHPASPYIALWNRLHGFDPADLDAAFASYGVVKSKLLRMTLHAHLPEDYPAFRDAMQPSYRANGLNSRFRSSGLTADEADALFGELMPFLAEARTSDEIRAWFAETLGRPCDPGLWRAFAFVAPVLHAPTGRPWSFGRRTSFVASGTPAAPATPETCAEALTTLVRRYLEGFGPASMADVAQFALVQRSRAKGALTALSDELEVLEGPGGTTLYDVPDAARPDANTPAPPRLLPMWESVLLAYADRSRVIPPQYRKAVTRSNGDTLPTVLVDGYVAGVWRAAENGIEATAFHRLDDDTWDGLAAEAQALVALLADREPNVYRRYDRWWDELPRNEVRQLPG